MEKKGKTLGVRFNEHDWKRLERFKNETTVDAVTLARAATCAALDFYEKAGKLSFPLLIVPIGALDGVEIPGSKRDASSMDTAAREFLLSDGSSSSGQLSAKGEGGSRRPASQERKERGE